MPSEETLYLASVWVIPVLLAITLHEAAHGWVAWKLGDTTAKQLGRVSFNPFRHIDPVGTILVPAMLILLKSPILFGWAKPVPVDYRKLNEPRRDMTLVAAAGPTSNIILALASGLFLNLLPLLPVEASGWAQDMLINSILLNVILAVINMVPMPPLDGGRVAVGLLPPALGARLARLEKLGLVLILALVFVLPLALGQAGIDFSPLRWLVEGPIYSVVRGLIALTTGQWSGLGGAG